MLRSLGSTVSPCATATNDVIARTFFAAIETDLLVAGRMAGVHGMLGCLNARARYRFTGIYPLVQRGVTRMAYLYDRELPGPANTDDPDFARIALAIVAAERPSGAATEVRRLTTIEAGVGAMLLSGDGLPWGVLCHFDLRLRAAPPTELPVLKFLGARAPVWLEPQLHDVRPD
jgi:hypothetical protein